MSRSHPHCDRHPNLQMVPCRLKRSKAVVSGHVCPVPGCGRYHVEQEYLPAAAAELVAGPTLVERAEAPKKASAKSASHDRPLNRQTAARAAILKAIDRKQGT